MVIKDIIRRKVGGVHMELKPWMFAAMEEKGIMDTKQGKINRLVNYLNECDLSYIGTSEWMDACATCDVDYDSLDARDLSEIERKNRCAIPFLLEKGSG